MHSLERNPVLYCVAGILLTMVGPIRHNLVGLFVLFVPIVTFAYFAYHKKDDEVSMPETEIGDNCYLIGFIYTLSVITMSLFFDSSDLLAGVEGPEEREKFLATIGIALGTSVFGMALRMWFHNMAIDKITLLDDSLTNVTDQAWKLKQVFDELNKSTQAANSEAHNYVYTLKIETEKLLTEFMSSLSSIPGKIDDRFKETMDDIFSKIKADLDEILAKHLEASDRINQDTLSEFRELLNETQKAKAGLRTLSGSLNEISVALTKTHTDITDFNTRMVEMGNLAEAQGKKADLVKETSAEFEKVMQDHIRTIRELESQIREQYEGTVRTATEESEKLYSALLALAKEASATEEGPQEGPSEGQDQEAAR